MASSGYQDQEPDYQGEHRGGKEKIARNQRRPSYSRGQNRPATFNGMHRRRNKRLSW